MAQLVVQYPTGRRVAYPLGMGDVIIGRDASCDVTIEDRITSRQHARISRNSDGNYWIHDLESKNGISLNERAVTAAPVRPGDRIGIGSCELRIEEERETGPRLVDTPATDGTGATTSAWNQSERLNLPQRRLQTLYDLNERLTGRFERDDLLGELLTVCVEQLRFERAGIAVWEGEPKRLEWTHLRNFAGGGQEEFRISRSVVDRALHKGERILILDTGDAEINPTASMISNHITSAMCVPMEYLGEVRGVVYGDRVSSAGGYTREDIDFFAAVGRLGAMGLANVHLVDELRRRQEIETQLRLARQIQSQLFPQGPLEQDGLRVHALNDPGAKVSGDYYDYFVRPDGQVAIVIADVAGKGVSASLLMANLQAAVRLLLMESTDLVAAVREINRLICSNIAISRFITAFFGLLDLSNRRLTYVNCGHLPPMVIRPGEGVQSVGAGRRDDSPVRDLRCETPVPARRDDTPAPLAVSGLAASAASNAPGAADDSSSRVDSVTCEAHLPLGIEADYVYGSEVIDLREPQSTVFLYTDGVNEAQDEDGAQFGTERLLSALESGGAQGPRDLMARVRRLIKQFTRNHPQSDDITMLAFQLP